MATSSPGAPLERVGIATPATRGGDRGGPHADVENIGGRWSRAGLRCRGRCSPRPRASSRQLVGDSGLARHFGNSAASSRGAALQHFHSQKLPRQFHPGKVGARGPRIGDNHPRGASQPKLLRGRTSPESLSLGPSCSPHRRWQARGAHAPRSYSLGQDCDVVLPPKGMVHDGERAEFAFTLSCCVNCPRAHLRCGGAWRD